MNGYWLIIAFTLGWAVAQLIKIIIGCFMDKDMTFKKIAQVAMKSGGMPSGHTSSFAALSTCTGLLYGFDSPIFAIVLCTMLIIIYDAVNVRFVVGEQGKVMNRIIRDSNKYGNEIKVVEGHTVLQVIMGGITGVISGIIVALISGGIVFS